MNTKLKAGLAFAAIFALFYVGFWRWMVCRVYVEPGEILVLTNKLGDENPNPDRDRVVKEGVKGVQADVFGEFDRFYQIESSTNLAEWQTLTEILATNATFTFTDSSSASPAWKFYRAVTLP